MLHVKDVIDGDAISTGATLVAGRADVPLTGITADSRLVAPGMVFVALAGTQTDGSRFIDDAVARGAAAVLVPTGWDGKRPQTVVVLSADEPRRSLARIAAIFTPRQPQHIVAVTGTNGKTSVADFTRQLFASLGHRAASLGTIGVVKPEGAVYGSLTTPDPVTLHRTLDGLAGEGITHLALEASSHGLDQFRLDGVRLAAGAFLNLGRDHLDYHPDIEHYLHAKLGLFTRLLQPGQPAIIVADGRYAVDAYEMALVRALEIWTVGTGSGGVFGLADPARRIRLASIARDGFGQRLTVEHQQRTFEIKLGLIGAYQASNALVAAAFALALGEDPARTFQALATLQGVPGRLEVVGERHGGLVVVDYAHKPEALGAALAALRPFATGRLICVMGCGGNRDAGKRPIMGRIAAEAADMVIVTDDNPRFEAAADIRRAVLAGVPADADHVTEIGDRGAAIAAAIGGMRAGDVVLIAGKGHETGQIVGAKTLPFSDQAAARAALSNGCAS